MRSRWNPPPKERRKGCLTGILIIALAVYGLFMLYQHNYLNFETPADQSILNSTKKTFSLTKLKNRPQPRPQQVQENEGDEEEALFPQDGIYIYSLYYCVHCQWKESQLRKTDLSINIYYIDKDPERYEQMRRIKERYLDLWPSYPVVIVDGTVLPNSPSIEEIKAAQK